MSETILSKLESSRKELLDLGLRNSLLNYKLPSNRGLHIVVEKSAEIYEILVKQGKSMSFLGRTATKENDNKIEFVEFSESELQESYSDTKLQTNETEVSLQRRLLNTYYSARTCIEEQGVNILYISLGMLHWFESDNSQEERLAPLLLIPVSLERSSARERFRVRYSLEEVGLNISLQAKIKTEFGLTIPDLPDIDDFNVETYIESINAVARRIPRWVIEKDAIELGFFSFGKFMIYNDLDSNKWPQDKKPIEHVILQDLFENGFRDQKPSISENAFIDDDPKASELFQVVDADSSQILAMLAIQEGRNLIIQGPPGTGKSQTITNIIADAVANGKKVLFVAEKLAALEVVKRRLDTIHLAETCLELHSHKANKKELHIELRRILELGRPSLQKLQHDVNLLEKYRSELNAYCNDVNTEIGRSELTPHKVIGNLLQLSDLTEGITLPKIQIPDIKEWDAGKMKRAEAFVELMQARLKDIGPPNQLLFWGSQLKVLLPNETAELSQLFEQSIGSVEELRKETEVTAGEFDMTIPVDRNGSISLSLVAQLISGQPDLSDMNVKSKEWILNKEDIREILESGKRLTELHDKYDDLIIREAWDYDVLELKSHLLAHGRKWYKFLIGAYNRTNTQLRILCKGKLPKGLAAKLQYLDVILESKRLEAVLNDNETLIAQTFGLRWEKLKSDWSLLSEDFKYLTTLHQKIADGDYPKEILEYLSKNKKPKIANERYQALLSVINLQQDVIQKLVDKMELNEQIRFPECSLMNQPFKKQLDIFSAWKLRINEIHQVILWNNLSETAIDENLKFLIDVSIYWESANHLLKTALQKSWYEFLLQQALLTFPSLRKFERASHEEISRQFKKLDILNLQLNRARVALKHWENMPRLEAGGQVNILRSEFNKQRRHLPIRKLMQHAGLAIQAIKPVFMMSPLSIANFIPPGSIEFDLVIFDEASQVKPVDALGAILRGKQLIVVGDSKQLPPTSFFDSLNKDIEEEENVTSDLQSILDMCDAKGAPQRMLRWHYRSRHESLISVSNYEFYENKLVVFPSPGSRHRMGLAYHYLKDTIYDRGKTRTNAKEAEIVADAVIEHAKKHPKLSLGVVAFSSAQRQAIQDLLEIKRTSNPDLEPFFNSHADEPFFVKNLENVQGDERDVIFISIGYGRTQEGYVPMSFGPLNNEGGERRLNVLITRAKLRCEVFTNITSDDIDLDRVKHHGIKALKRFLYFAQHGKLNITAETGLPADSPFEENVANHLEKMGYVVRKQVGSQGFYIDLAIIDPENSGRYILGIECDGAAYHSARSARDRDRLRQEVLEGIGWRIHRIWSTDWFRNPQRELKRVIEAIEKARELLRVDDEASNSDEEISQTSPLMREQVLTLDFKDISHYECAQLSHEVAHQEIHLHPIGKISTWIVEIVKKESPVHFDEVARRITESGGVSRVGSRIRGFLKYAAKVAANTGQIRFQEEFLWDSQMETPTIRDRSNLPSSARKINYISPEEVTEAIKVIVRNSIAITPIEAVPLVLRMFGFNRVTEEMKNFVLQIINKSVLENKVVLDGELLKSLQ